MAVRYLKIILVVFVGLNGWLYVAGNTANWSAAVAAVGYVLSMQGHDVYGAHIFPAITSPVLVVIALLIILTGEFLVGALSLKGAWDLWKARHARADVFNAAKSCAVLGTGMAMVVWFGGFVVIAGALFQMWQTTLGHGSFSDAGMFAVTAGVIMLFVNMPDA